MLGGAVIGISIVLLDRTPYEIIQGIIDAVRELSELSS